MRLANLLRLAAAAVATFAITTTSAAADGIPGVVMTDSQYVTDWSGPYIGGKVGGAWGTADWTQENANFFSTSGTRNSFSPNGVIGGVIGGANLQMGQWVFGAELSFSGSNASSSITSPFRPATDTFSTDIEWLATVEGRVGYSWNRTMAFIKGGWAGGDVKLTLNDSAAGVTATETVFAKGWTIGGGVEYAVWNSVLLGVEYDYTHLAINEGSTLNCLGCGTGVAGGSPIIDSDIKMSAVMVRMSYLFAAED